MRLETSQELLERLRAQHNCSWYGLAHILGAHEKTIANWKNGRTVMDRKFATRVAELLEEPPEYVLACLEFEREQDAGARKLWRSIAAKFRSHAASVLLLAIAGALLSPPEKTSAFEHVPPSSSARTLYIM